MFPIHQVTEMDGAQKPTRDNKVGRRVLTPNKVWQQVFSTPRIYEKNSVEGTCYATIAFFYFNMRFLNQNLALATLCSPGLSSFKFYRYPFRKQTLRLKQVSVLLALFKFHSCCFWSCIGKFYIRFVTAAPGVGLKFQMVLMVHCMLFVAANH